MKNKIFNLIVIISACIFLSFFVFSNGLTSLVHQFKTLSFYWLIIALLCIITFWMLETIILYIITKILYTTRGLFIKLLKVAMIGQFFSAITPLQSGGQPAQLYAMTENGMPPGYSGSILAIKFIIHQATFTFYSLLVLLLKFNYFNSKIQYFIYLSIFGFIVNFAILFALLFLVSNKMANNKIGNKILLFILRFLKKIKIIKDVASTYEELKKELISFHESAVYITKNIKICLYSSILTFLQWTTYYAIPYCIYRSFGLNSTDIWTMIAAQVFLTLFMSFIPLPGAAVGAEGGFFVIFGIFFKGSTLVPAMFLWRIITYYLTIGVGGLFTVILPNTDKNIKKDDI